MRNLKANKTAQFFLAALLALPNSTVHAATTRYVDASGTNPVSPYLNWSTAATNIQDALNASGFQDLILVTNGIYAYGGYSFSGSNRVYAANSQTILSINGPAFTVIEGYQVPGTTNGVSAVRCVYLQKGTTLSGFTLTNGATQNYTYGGGVYATGATVSNCVIINNAAYDGGGGAYQGSLINCQLIGNTAIPVDIGAGGGACQSTLINCLLVRNFAGYIGGATLGGVLINCTVASNSAAAYSGSLSGGSILNSIVYYNYSYYTNADTVSDGIFSNCCVSFSPPGGANNFTNPPLFANSAAGDYHLSAASPCINAGNNAFVGISNDLDGNPRIVNSRVDLGAYESPYNVGVHYVNIAGANPVPPFNGWNIAATNIQDAVDAATNGDLVLVTNGVYQTGARLTSDGASNRVVVSKAVTLESVNGPSATVIAGVYARLSSVRCVYLADEAALTGFTLANGGSMQSGGGAWCEDSNVTISNCVITNGFVYQSGGGTCGGQLFNCILINNTADQYGGGAFQGALFNCLLTNNHAYYGGGAGSNTLANCTLADNFAQNQGLNSGGGAIYCALSNCLLIGNASWGGGGAAAFSSLTGCTASNNTANAAGGGLCTGFAINCVISSNQTMNTGGGAYSNTLLNCVLRNNLADSIGGGACQSALVNCTVVSNAASGPSVQPAGGGVFGGSATNCIIYYNSALKDPNLSGSASVNYCCTMPSASGLGNITNEPLFVNLTGEDLHLQSNSPCINSGNNVYATSTTDLDGNPRIVGGTVDMGAYEYQSPVSQISYAWLDQYGLPITTGIDGSDLDGNGFTVYQDWIAGLNPTNALSVLSMLPPAPTNNPTGLVVSWESVSNRSYFLQSSTNLAAQPAFSTIQSNIAGLPGTTSYTDTAATNAGPYFYRVGVQ